MPSGNTRSGPWRQPSAQKEAGKRLRRKARASSSTREALRYHDASRVRKLCFRFGKASSAGVAHHHPNAQAQPRKAPSTAIHALRPTPGSKLPSTAKREQALALKKRCGTKTLLECAKLCFRFGEASPAGVAHHHPNAQAQPRKAPSTTPHPSLTWVPGLSASVTLVYSPITHV